MRKPRRLTFRERNNGTCKACGMDGALLQQDGLCWFPSPRCLAIRTEQEVRHV